MAILAAQRQSLPRMRTRFDVLSWQDSLMKIDAVTMMRRKGVIIGKLGPEIVG
ncbi:MAG: hypothetical protein ABSE36_19335 [Terracidiphilus sp.]